MADAAASVGRLIAATDSAPLYWLRCVLCSVRCATLVLLTHRLQTSTSVHAVVFAGTRFTLSWRHSADEMMSFETRSDEEC